jgi:rhodanese-related sulfurtransferase
VKLKTLTVIESVKNILDVGVIIESVNNARKHRVEMGPIEFLKQLFWGKGYVSITPPQLSEKMEQVGNDLLIIDLREGEQFEKSRIDSAIWSPFDGFLKNVLVDQEYDDYLDKEIVLVCDTGHMSRVAGAVLAEEGFERIFSLSRGMRRWNRWQKMLTQHSRLSQKRVCCLGALVE